MSPEPVHFLVTAGNTREKIDAVRDWGNIFTGNTGFSIAKSLAELGEVDLLTSNRAHQEQAAELKLRYPVRTQGFIGHADLKEKLRELVAGTKYRAIFMTAAVSDYSPAGVFQILRREASGEGKEVWEVRSVQAGKVKGSYESIAVAGKRTEKIVDMFRRDWGYKGLLVKFKLEVGITKEELIRIGHESRKASGADYLVANTLEMVEGSSAGAFLLGEGVEEWVPRAQLATRLCKLVAGT